MEETKVTEADVFSAMMGIAEKKTDAILAKETERENGTTSNKSND
jgi:hypothetical protein